MITADTLTLALVQTSIFAKDIHANMATLEELFWQQITTEVDVIVLPETFATGFCVDDVSVAEPMNTAVTKWMKQIASQWNAIITGSVLVRDGSNYYNRMLWVTPAGDVAFYDKRYLFKLSDERLNFTSGNAKTIFTINGWSIKPIVCYDLRFPEWCRNTTEYDLLLCVANWPSSRIHHWDSLLQARAIENQSYAVGVNRLGKLGQLHYNGHSKVINYNGDIIADLHEDQKVCIVSLYKNKLKEYRRNYPFLEDMVVE